MRLLRALLALSLLLLSIWPAQAAAPPRPGQPYQDSRCSTDPNILLCEDFDFAQNFLCAGATGSQGNNMAWTNPGLTTSGKSFPFQYCSAADFPKLSTLGIPAGLASGGVYRADMKKGAASASYDGCILGDCDRNTSDTPQTYQNGSPASNDLYFQMSMYHSPNWYWPSTAYGLDNKVLFLYPNKYTSKTDANVDAGLYFNASGRCNGSPQACPDCLSFRVGSNSQSYKWFPAHLSAGTSTEYCPAGAVGAVTAYTNGQGKLYRMPLGQWVTVEFRYKLSDPGQKNGIIEAWINGTKIYSASNLETCGNYGANEGSCYAIHEIFFEGSWFNPLYGDVAAAQSRGGYRLIDNFIISKSYIGLVSEAVPPPVEPPPANLSASLAWDANTESDLVGYKIYRLLGACGSLGPMQLLADVGNVTTYIDQTVPPTSLGSTYAVTAYDTAANESVKSATACKSFAPPPPPPPVDTDGDGVPDTTDQCPTVAGPASNNGCPLPPPPPPDTTPPAAPSGLRIVSISGGTAVVSWEPAARATGYEIQRLNTTTNKWVSLASATAPPSQAKLPNAGRRLLRVCAVNPAGKTCPTNHGAWATR